MYFKQLLMIIILIIPTLNGKTRFIIITIMQADITQINLQLHLKTPNMVTTYIPALKGAGYILYYDTLKDHFVDLQQ